MSINDLSDTVIAKSDQLNADDLIGATKTIVVSGVKRYSENGSNAFSINYEGDCGRPFKPCKTMRKVILLAWGADGSKWIGRSMTLYNDPKVVYAGKEVGGVRISHISDITKNIIVNLTVTRGKKKEHAIKVLEPQEKPTWPDEALSKKLPAITQAIEEDRVTNEQAITQLEVKANLTDEQKKAIRDIGSGDLTVDEDEFLTDE